MVTEPWRKRKGLHRILPQRSLAEERKWGGLTERLLVATSASYVVSPGAMGPVAVDTVRPMDRLSASYLIALGARIVHEVADLIRRAKDSRKGLATLAVDTEIRFRPADARTGWSSWLTPSHRSREPSNSCEGET